MSSSPAIVNVRTSVPRGWQCPVSSCLLVAAMYCVSRRSNLAEWLSCPGCHKLHVLLPFARCAGQDMRIVKKVMKVMIKCFAKRHICHSIIHIVRDLRVVSSALARLERKHPSSTNAAAYGGGEPDMGTLGKETACPSLVVTETWLVRQIKRNPIAVKKIIKPSPLAKYHAARSHAAIAPHCVVHFEVCVPEPARSRIVTVQMLLFSVSYPFRGGP